MIMQVFVATTFLPKKGQPAKTDVQTLHKNYLNGI